MPIFSFDDWESPFSFEYRATRGHLGEILTFREIAWLTAASRALKLCAGSTFPSIELSMTPREEAEVAEVIRTLGSAARKGDLRAIRDWVGPDGVTAIMTADDYRVTVTEFARYQQRIGLWPPAREGQGGRRRFAHPRPTERDRNRDDRARPIGGAK
jgi:hypothetical protein